MGAVHGVYLKYVALSGLSYLGYNVVMDGVGLLALAKGEYPSDISGLTLGFGFLMAYSTILNGTIAALFKAERGMGLIGKDTKRGTIPLWSYILYAPFHGPTWYDCFKSCSVCFFEIFRFKGSQRSQS